MSEVSCARAREVLSARLDGEAADELGDRQVDAHLAGCPRCRAWQARLGPLDRELRVQPALPVPDLTEPILGSVSQVAARRRAVRHVRQLRVGLVLVAVLQLLLTSPMLLVGMGVGEPAHIARQLGSFHIAVAVGFLVVGLSPGRASGLLPVVAALTICLTAAAGVDVLTGHVSAVAEAHHLLQVIGLVVVWRLARRARRVPAWLSTDQSPPA